MPYLLPFRLKPSPAISRAYSPGPLQKRWKHVFIAPDKGRAYPPKKKTDRSLCRGELHALARVDSEYEEFENKGSAAGIHASVPGGT